MEEARFVGVDAAVEHEDVCWLHWWSNTKSLGSFDIIGAVEKLRAPLPVQSLAKLISCAEVARWYIILYETHIALRFASFLKPCEVWIDIGLAPLASERSFITKVDQRHHSRLLGIVILRRLRQRLYHDTEIDPALLLHLHSHGRLHGSCSNEPRAALPFIQSYLRNCRSGRELSRCCAVLNGVT